MKKALLIIGIIVGVYLIILVIFNAVSFCPKYVNRMPGIQDSSISQPWQKLFCPFAKKVY